MGTRRTIAFLALLLVGVLVATWMLADPADTRHSRLNMPLDDQTSHAGGTPLTGELPVTPEPDTGETGKEREHEVSAPSAVDEVPSASTQTEQPAEPDHVPLYGIAVQRGGATAVFTLTDGRDQPLYQTFPTVELWRRVGAYWQKDDAYWDVTRRAIVCDGRSAAGLEPGEYELDVSAGHYGSLTHRFHVNRGERLESALRTENWRRIVCIEFLQPDGTPVDWLKDTPIVRSEADEAGFIDRSGKPRRVLRDPPSSISGGRGGRGGFAWRRARGSGARSDEYMYATDAGRFHVPVIAGAMNTIEFRCGEYWGREQLQLEGRFTGAEWDRYTVTLELVPEFDELTRAWTRYGEADPGARSAIDWVSSYLNPPAPDDPAQVRDRRLVIDLQAEPGVSVVYGIQLEPDDPFHVDRTMQRRGSLHYADASAGSTIHFAFEFNGKRASLPEAVTFNDDLPGPVHRISRRFVLNSLKTPDWGLTPTLEAWAVQRWLQVSLDWHQVNTPRLSTWRLDHALPTFHVPESLPAQLRETPPGGVELKWEIAGAVERADSEVPWKGRWNDNLRQSGIVNTDGETLQQALRGGEFSPPVLQGLALRAVGPNLEGLPWVEGSIVPYELDARARKLRDIERRLAEDGERPFLRSDFVDAYAQNENDFNEEAIDPERMRTFLGPKFIEQTDDRADLAYYARSGAWYNTRERLMTDEAGYFFADVSSVRPGRRYVLYLWGGSRDDLQPDARIVFTAGEDITDLGAISLPTYSK